MAIDIETRKPVIDVTARDPIVTQSTDVSLSLRFGQYLGDFKGALVNHVTVQCRNQGRLLEEASRHLDVFKKVYYVYYKAERDAHDREARFEQEKQTLYNEIHQIKAIEAREKRVAVLTGGDGDIFLPSLIVEGKKGVRDAATRLTESI